ncbi:hypothetical protein [Streptomyces phaeoluteigriseus]|uniref:hypothetical protein n=1 Tax=Streptomyces phaeoluteigriseus TaxID=114686 RepID=UPI0036D0A80A
MTRAVVLFTSDPRPHDRPTPRPAPTAADAEVAPQVGDPGVHTAGFDAPSRDTFPTDRLTAPAAAPHRHGTLNPVVQRERCRSARNLRTPLGTRTARGGPVPPRARRARLDHPQPVLDLSDGPARPAHARGRY